jgi:hypothetical protein
MYRISQQIIISFITRPHDTHFALGLSSHEHVISTGDSYELLKEREIGRVKVGEVEIR